MRISAAASALVALVVALSACGGGHQTVGPGGYVPPPSSPKLASPAATSTAGETPTTPASATEATTIPDFWNTPKTPTWEAAQFVTAEKGYSWDQPGGIGGWVLKARPYCGPSYGATLDHRVQSAEAAQAAGPGDSGDAAFWQQVRSEKQTVFINPTNAYVITEAGVTPTSEWVRVTYNTTDVTAGNPDPAPQYGGQEDLIMSKVGRRWLVTGEGSAAGEG